MIGAYLRETRSHDQVSRAYAFSTHATYTYASNGLTAGTTFVSPNGSYADAKFHIVGARRTSNQIVVSVDGQASSPTSFLAGAAVIGAPLYLGGGPLNGIFNGDVAEAIIVSGPLSDPDHTNLVSYFKSKFAL